MVRRVVTGTVFTAALAFGIFGRVDAVSSSDPWCPEDNEQYCEVVDEGCHSQDPHYWCLWRELIEHCNCTLVLPPGAY
jgi:hypothetical protein